MRTWPRSQITAQRVEWSLVTPGQDAGATLGGVPQRTFLSGGPYWRLTLSGLVMEGTAAIKAGRALQGHLGNGERPILMRPCDCRQVPRLAAGVDPVVATIMPASLRAASVTLSLTGHDPDRLVGSLFSVPNSVWGERPHRIIRRTGGTDDAPVVTIRPLLRQAVTVETSVDFETPGCVMRVDGPMALEETIRHRLHTGSVSFCELERPPTEAEL